MADTFANQPLARLAAALEQALVKGALKGDKTLLDQLRREVVAIQQDVTADSPPPVYFQGKKQLVFEALLAGCTQTEAAKRSGMSRSHVNRYASDPVVVRALADARAERARAANEALSALVPLSVGRLRGILTDAGATHQAVIAASREVLDRAGIVARKGVELSGPGGAPVSVDVHALATMSPDQLRALALVHAAPGEVDSTADLPAEDADP